MVEMVQATRLHPLHAGAVSVGLADNATRVSLRAKPDAIMALSKALGLDLPVKPKSTASRGARTALWIGPDEWLIIDSATSSLVDDLAKVKVLHSAVEVSHRNVGILVSGKGADAVINGGCPQDLSLKAFPVSAASRTVLGKIEIVLWRMDEDSFRVECWRSFSTYAYAFLQESARDVAV
ncbi:sarcosine oxidase subunit gamma [Phyllobacterium brassicacearum]|uniref:Sarcosine oxidase subunit gamma n=1 Tax=Phyllobacterium brassicacearum TaxID=314235 RepID=A0A2P7AXU5_9HYPH|nr:sarcosine oxidase subunit gamma [Phyllobacterium brassicacearum]PSH59028.1 sarcosine oxidase subunit gamma [Phyllobacterium brassicacearum]TDQ08054.1 heterotetrameric sarcosine oxidase gamma subunit [Phyllobacterium brassicacearum]